MEGKGNIEYNGHPTTENLKLIKSKDMEYLYDPMGESIKDILLIGSNMEWESASIKMEIK